MIEKRPLGRTGIDVPVLCLGTMTFGRQNSKAEAYAIMDRAYEAGITFIDVAEMYPTPPEAHDGGESEEIVGAWIKDRGLRDKVTVASKVLGRSPMVWLRKGDAAETRLDAASIREAVDASLKRLQMDVIDLYQVHWPDRSVNKFGNIYYNHNADEVPVPIEETLETLTDLVKAGKIRAIGLSNETPWGISEYLRLHREKGLARVASIQNPYSLVNRAHEVGCTEYAHREDVGLLAYSPIAMGLLSGKYLDGQRPEGARLTLFDRYGRYLDASAEPGTRAYVDLAKEAGITPSQLALAWVISRPFVTSCIFGARTLEQLEENLGALEVSLNDDILSKIDVIERQHTMACP